jgi:hypothetical protein
VRLVRRAPPGVDRKRRDPARCPRDGSRGVPHGRREVLGQAGAFDAVLGPRLDERPGDAQSVAVAGILGQLSAKLTTRCGEQARTNRCGV